MKWGKYLSENMIQEWKDFYVQYKSLKKFISMSELNRSDIDEQFFIQKVEQQVQMIEKCFIQVRNNCLFQFDKVKQELPESIKQNLPCLEGYTSFPVSTRTIEDEIKKEMKLDDDDDDMIADDIQLATINNNNNNNNTNNMIKNDNSQNTHKNSNGNDHSSNDDSIASMGAPRSIDNNNSNSNNKATVSAANVPIIEEENALLGISSNIEMKTRRNTDNNDNDRLLSESEEEDDDDDDDDDDDEDENEENENEFEFELNQEKPITHRTVIYDESESRTRTQTKTKTKTTVSRSSQQQGAQGAHGARGTQQLIKLPHKNSLDDQDFIDAFAPIDKNGYPLIQPPKCVYQDYELFSHLPTSAHRECLMILTTLGRLKLFGWQNSEGLRKIIKKFDKRFGCSLTQTLWPKIKLSEFVQEIKTDSYIAQVAAVLCTRTIPFDSFDANDLRESGVNLRQMATAIQQLENVVEMQYPEVIPMNVEPRSYMANERTWLKWMRMAAFTTLVGMILISMNHEPVTGVLMVLLSMAVMCRSYFEYNMRNRCLIARKDHEWIDYIGPKLLLLSFLLPCFTYFAYLIYFKDTQIVFHK